MVLISQINHLHDISNIHAKFDNNRSSSFGDYVSNMNMDTDRQTETGDYFFRTFGVMKCRENIKVAFRPMDSITILPSFTLGK